MTTMTPLIATAFLEVLAQLDLIENVELVRPFQVCVHPTIGNQWTVQYFDVAGIQRAEGIYIGTETAATVRLEWANTPLRNRRIYNLSFRFEDSGDTGVLKLCREAVAA